MNQNNEVEGVQFETDSYKAVKFYNETDTPKIVKLVMRYSGGLIKDEKKANYFLFGFVVMSIVVSSFLFLFSGGGNSHPKPTPERIREINNIMHLPN